jgi:hypothetical protein
MVEVFKTNVGNTFSAKKIVALIHTKFAGYTANFDLEDCDNILRIQSMDRSIEVRSILQLMKDQGLHAEILHDIIGAGHQWRSPLCEPIAAP